MTRNYLQISRYSQSWKPTGKTIGEFVELAVYSTRHGTNFRYVTKDALYDTKRYPHHFQVFTQENLKSKYNLDATEGE